jgi:hypothetical protein
MNGSSGFESAVRVDAKQMRYDCQQSTSIPRNDHPENHNEEGSAPNLGQRCADRAGTGNSHFLAASDPIPKEASFSSVHVALKRKKRPFYVGFLHFQWPR